MKYEGNKATGLKIAYVGGGSRGWAWGLMSDLALDGALSGTVYLYDIDYEAAKRNEKIGNSIKNNNNVPGKWDYTAVENAGDAFKDAEIVIISIMPGTFDEMESDVHLPEKYGIFQSVGDTTGPGGIVRALRTIPMMKEIAYNIERYCPNAWVINYTNPMAICVNALYSAFPKIKAFGCCHEVFGTQKLLASALKEFYNITDVAKNEIKLNVLGTNHFTWVDKAFYREFDLIKLFADLVERYYETGYQPDADYDNPENPFRNKNRVKFDLFKRYNIIAAAGDRHLAEFLPGSWYLKDPETVEKWGFALTPVSFRRDDLKKRLEKSRKLLAGEMPFDLEPTGEEGVEQIKAVLGLRTLVTNVNLPNRGQMSDVPLGAVVETNSAFRDNLVTPLFAGRLPDEVHAHVLKSLINQMLIMKAEEKKDIALAFRAFINDPLVTCSPCEAEELFVKMLENTKNYLQGWKI